MEKLNAINDGYEPENSGDKGPGAYGNWNQTSEYKSGIGLNMILIIII
jgi:hypothetical protein